MKIHKSDSLICIEMEDISYSSVSIIEQKKLKLFTENTQYIYYKNTRIYIWIAIWLEFITTRTSKHTTKTTTIILSTQLINELCMLWTTLCLLSFIFFDIKREKTFYFYTLLLLLLFIFISCLCCMCMCVSKLFP